MDAFGVPTTLLRTPRRRAYNLSRYKSLPSYFSFLAATGLDTESAPAPRRGQPNIKIIVRHPPRLQGETFTGLSQQQRKFSDVASVHHFSVPARG
jgi:hypothetical protein